MSWDNVLHVVPAAGCGQMGVKKICKNCGKEYTRYSSWAYGQCCTYSCFRAQEKKAKKPRDVRRSKESWKASIAAAQDRVDYCLCRSRKESENAKKYPLRSVAHIKSLDLAKKWRYRAQSAQNWIEEQSKSPAESRTSDQRES